MSSLEKRLEAFRQLPLRAQLALIASSRVNPVLGKNQEYIEGLERVHAECLLSATPQQRLAYEKARENLTLNWRRQEVKLTSGWVDFTFNSRF